MKKQLLLIITLSMSVMVVAQNHDLSKISKFEIRPMVDYLQSDAQTSDTIYDNYESSQNLVNKDLLKVDISSSLNVYGLFVVDQRVVSYIPEADMIVHAQRSGGPIPGGTGNDIKVSYSTDGGATWPFSVVTTTSPWMFRYPSTAIYNPVGNSNPLNMFAIVSGPYTDPSGWVGQYFGSQKLDGTLKDITFEPNEPAVYINHMNLNTTAFSDGHIHVASSRLNGDATTYEWAGFEVLNGMFNPSTNSVDWELPRVVVYPSLVENRIDAEYMVYSPDGSVGYLCGTGVDTDPDYNLYGVEWPIIYKTTDYGVTWEKIAPFDFSQIGIFQDSLSATLANPNVTIPRFFNKWVGGHLYNGYTVDMNNNLHIFAWIKSTVSIHPDSLVQFWDDKMLFHMFMYGDGTWDAKYVVALNTVPVDLFTVSHDHRLQMCRTEVGDKVFCVWNDTDPIWGVTTNINPDVLMYGYDVVQNKHTQVVNVTDLPSIYFGDNFLMHVSNIVSKEGTTYHIPVQTSDPPTSGSGDDPFINQYLMGVTIDESDFNLPNSIVSFPYYQSFETGMNEWLQSSGDNFDWSLNGGPTPTANTGPDNAYDGTIYAYTESSSPNYPNKTAGMYAVFDFSYLLNPNLSFWYHMYGSTTGTLKVQVSTNNGNTWSDLWIMTGNQGNQWINAVVNLSGYSYTNNILLRFWGITGSNQYSDMAVDYIEVSGTLTPDIEINPTSLTINESSKNEKTKNNSIENLTAVDLLYKMKINNKSIVDTIIDNNDTIIRINVPGYPPENYKAPIASYTKSSVILSNTPAYDWSFGCSATSAAMMAGYYDNTGFPVMYSGPANGGIAPMNNSIWGSVIINGEVRKQCPLSATRMGVDGRAIYGHVDDYWILYGSMDPDPFIGNWTQHTYGDCTGDYMKTNQSNFNNSDGSTTFYYFSNGSPFSGNNLDDGCYGLKLFFESRGYTVDEYYTQLIYGYNGNTLGFTFNQFKQEIDAGRPVLIHVEGHTMLGYGYDDSNYNIYIHDTWDYSDHQMVWGGDYSGLNQWGVGIFHLSGGVPFNNNEFVISNVGNAVLSINSIYEDLPWLNTTGFPLTPFNIDPGNGQDVVVNIDWEEVGDITQVGIINISSDDPDEPVVSVTVTAIPILVPSLAITPTSQTVTSASGSFPITVSSNIIWTVNESCGWLACNPSGGTSNGQFTINYDENTSINPRTCTITVSGNGINATCIVTQTGASPILSISPTTQNVGASSGVFTISVTSNTTWAIDENCSWLSCYPLSGTGSGQFAVNYNLNPTVEIRTCTITVIGSGINASCIVTQAAGEPNLTINPATQNVSSSFGSFQINVISNILWDVSESCEWLTCIPLSGNGNGQIIVNYDENTDLNPRTCIISVTGSGYTSFCAVSQEGADEILTIEPNIWNANASSGSFTINVTSNISWQVDEACDWLSCDPVSGIGNGQFTLNYDENTATAQRICLVTVTGSGLNANCEVVQDGITSVTEYNELSFFNLYPNPFKAAINVHYILPEKCKLTLTLYALVGNKVKEATWTSVNNEEKEISIPVDDLPSGIYFYSLGAISIDGNRFYKASGKMVKKE